MMMMMMIIIIVVIIIIIINYTVTPSSNVCIFTLHGVNTI